MVASPRNHERHCRNVVAFANKQFIQAAPFAFTENHSIDVERRSPLPHPSSKLRCVPRRSCTASWATVQFDHGYSKY